MPLSERHPVDRSKPPNILVALVIAVFLIILLVGCKAVEVDLAPAETVVDVPPETKVRGYVGICLRRGFVPGCHTLRISYISERQLDACEVSMWTVGAITGILLSDKQVISVFTQCVTDFAPPPEWWLHLRAVAEQET